jgi:hypothetical protein
MPSAWLQKETLYQKVAHSGPLSNSAHPPSDMSPDPRKRDAAGEGAIHARDVRTRLEVSTRCCCSVEQTLSRVLKTPQILPDGDLNSAESSDLH